jgi:AsmA protein
MPVKMDVKAAYLLADRIANLSSGVLRLGSSAANVAGTVDLKGTKPRLNARVDSSSLAVNDIESFLPALGIVLPSGARLEGGTASVKATAVGPPDALTIRGHVGLVNSRVTGYDLGSQMATVTKLSGIKVGKETLIQQFASDVQQSAAGSKLDNILLVLPGIGRLTGAGTIGKGNELNFAMKAQVDMSHSPVGQITSVLGRKNMMMGVPFHITGTTQQPKFTPDFAGGVPGVGSAGNLAQAVGGLTSKGVPAVPKGVPTIPKGAEGVTKGLGGLFGK